ncbi:hypothetical protein F5141DRAFT_1064197 [Pisolithus sp. B1]|nr:hypothetical protein F5141DRAFT_1064197 [Pisolithus sp. B1]
MYLNAGQAGQQLLASQGGPSCCHSELAKDSQCLAGIVGRSWHVSIMGEERLFRVWLTQEGLQVFALAYGPVYDRGQAGQGWFAAFVGFWDKPLLDVGTINSQPWVSRVRRGDLRFQERFEDHVKGFEGGGFEASKGGVEVCGGEGLTKHVCRGWDKRGA